MMRGLDPYRRGDRPTLKVANTAEDLMQTAEDVIAQARQLQELLKNRDTEFRERVSAVLSLRRKASCLGTDVQRTCDAIEEYIMAHIVYLGEPKSLHVRVGSLLSEFWCDIRPIIRRNLDADDEIPL